MEEFCLYRLVIDYNSMAYLQNTSISDIWCSIIGNMVKLKYQPFVVQWWMQLL